MWRIEQPRLPRQYLSVLYYVIIYYNTIVSEILFIVFWHIELNFEFLKRNLSPFSSIINLCVLGASSWKLYLQFNFYHFLGDFWVLFDKINKQPKTSVRIGQHVPLSWFVHCWYYDSEQIDTNFKLVPAHGILTYWVCSKKNMKITKKIATIFQLYPHKNTINYALPIFTTLSSVHLPAVLPCL